MTEFKGVPTNKSEEMGGKWQGQRQLPEQRKRPKIRATVEHCTETALFPNPISKYDSTIKTKISVGGHDPIVGRKASEDSV